MNKSDLIDRAAAEADISKAAAGRAIEAFLSGMRDGMKSGAGVAIAGFGSFKVTKRAARIGRNPKTGEPLKIKARKVPKFSASKTLKDAVQK